MFGVVCAVCLRVIYFVVGVVGDCCVACLVVLSAVLVVWNG